MSTITIPCPACGQGLKIRDRSLLGRRAKCPKCSHSFVLEEPAEVELQLASATGSGWAPSVPNAPPADSSPGFPVQPGVVATEPALAPVSRLHTSRLAKKKSKGWAGLVIGLGVCLLVAGGAYGLYVAQQSVPKIDANAAAAKGGGKAVRPAVVAAVSEELAASPTSGSNISLLLIPAGARTILHLRPAELWAAQSRGEEVRYCLGPLAQFAEAQIKAICKRPPADIEELLFAWIPGQRGTAPDWAVVVRLKNEVKKSELLDIVGGVINDSYGRPVYIEDDRAGLILDLKTYALGPASMAEDMVMASRQASPMPIGIESLIARTDSKRHLTLIFEPTAMLLDAEFMAPEAARPFLKQTMDWFGNDAESVLWSLHFENDRFYSDLQVRNTTSISTHQLEHKLRDKLDALPKEMYDLVRMMQPGLQGQREVIGRFPAMMKVAALSTTSDHGPRHVQLVTPLPERAAPNLALAALLAWDESTRTDFTREMPTAPSPGGDDKKLPIADMLRRKIDVDFRRTPLQEAFAYIAEETKVSIDIDGDALKLSGYTQNMPQTFKLDQSEGVQVIYEILKQYDQMCIIVDEQKRLVTVMTLPVAEQRGLKPFPVKP